MESRRELEYQAALVMATPSKSHLLAECDTDAERRELCLRWAAEARMSWFQGQAECIADVLRSRDLRFQHMNAETRRQIGRINWINTPQQKALANADQMYTRWADGYKGA